MDNQELTTQPSETKELSPLQQAANQIQTYAKKIVSDDRAGQYWTQVSVMAKQNPAIRNATPDSLITAMLACITLDLMPNTPEQLAYIIPYGRGVQFQVGYKGLLRLAHRSGQVRSVNAEVVYAGDTFEVELGTGRKLTHKPNYEVDRTDTSKITHAYAVIELTNGAIIFEVMTRSELDKIKNFAKATTTDAPWNKWYAEQCKKTVLKRAFKLIPSSTIDNRLELAAQYDSWAEAAKLKHENGQVVEGQALTPEEAEEIRKSRMEAAAAERKAMVDSEFTPEVVQPFYEGDDSQGPPAPAAEPTNPNYAEVSYGEVKQQVANSNERGNVPCQFPGCKNTQTAELAAVCTAKYGKTLCQKHWGMAKKGEIDPKGEWPAEVTEDIEGVQS